MRSKNRKGRGPDHGCIFIEDNVRTAILCYGPRREAAEARLDANGRNATLRLPGRRFRLEEVNLPSNLVRSLAGRNVAVQVYPEEQGDTRRINPGTESPAWIDPEGNYWNDYHPMRVLFTDADGQMWRLPRRWVRAPGCEPALAASYAVTQETTWFEEMHMPSEWDLQEINLGSIDASLAAGKPASVEIHGMPGRAVKVLWRDGSGRVWRLPHDWRRRRIKLPSYDVLISQDIASEVAEKYAGKIVSVNYHPGSLCCLSDAYRFRDGEGNRWPVKIQDCCVLGYGDREECRV